MITSVSDWVVFLRQGDAVIGFPLIIGGAALMLLGWRMWKLCVVLAYGLIGAGVGTTLGGGSPYQWVYALACGALFGAASYWPAKHAVGVLGGLIGASIAIYVMSDCRIIGPAKWISGVVVFIATAAISFINRRVVVIGVTAVLGAILVLSGATALVMMSPRLYGSFSALTSNSLIVVPFFLLVPAVMSFFYQVSEVHRHQAEL